MRRLLPVVLVRWVVLASCAVLTGCTSGASPHPTPPATESAGHGTTTDQTSSTPPPSTVGSTAVVISPLPTKVIPARTSSKRAATDPSSPAGTGPGPLVVLNPGHNGGNGAHSAEIARSVPAGFGQYKECDTTGTATLSGYTEHQFNWDVTLRVRALLQSRGVRVALTRQNDAGVGPCVDQRAAVGNAPGVAAVISIHADGTQSGAGHGFHACEDSRQPAGAAIAARSHALTVAVHDALVHGSGLVPSTYIGSNGYYPRSDLAGLNLAEGPATFLELGNMRNAGDADLLTSPAGRQRIAAAVASGILAYLGR